MIFSVPAEEHTPAYRSRPASRNRRPSALATPTRPGVDIGHFTGSAYQRNSCRRSSEIVSRPSSPVSQARAARASPAASGSSATGSPAPGSQTSCAQSAAGRCVRLVRVTLHRSSCRGCRAEPFRPVTLRHCVRHHGQVPGIYDEPEYYEAACAYRDVPAEVDALLRWSAKHHGRRGRFSSWAGPAEHARNLASAVLRPRARPQPGDVRRARDLAAAAGIPLTVVQADMRTSACPAASNWRSPCSTRCATCSPSTTCCATWPRSDATWTGAA